MASESPEIRRGWVEPAQYERRADGTLYSPRYADIYASADGALAETEHVFLRGNDLPARWQHRDNFTIVETGFGLGLNFLATWAAWRSTSAPSARLHFISAEKHPFRRDDLAAQLQAWPQLCELAPALLQRLPPAVAGFHRVRLEHGRLQLTLMYGDALTSLRQLDAQVDAFYLDGFAPARNPEMWSQDLFGELRRLARPGATAATYSIAGAVRERLTQAGFTVERAAGFARKREMLIARAPSSSGARSAAQRDRRAAVIGAGLAGTACAAHLAEKGWSVEVIDSQPAPALGASGNPAGLLMPALSVDWNPATRLTVQAYLYALQWIEHVNANASPDTGCTGGAGVLQIARDDADAIRQQRIVDAYDLPADMVQCVSHAEAGRLAGHPVAGPGWWFPRARWLDPASLCRANLAVKPDAISVQFNREVAKLRRTGDEWEMLDSANAVIGRAPTVVLANARAAGALTGSNRLQLQVARGQVSYLAERLEPLLPIALCRDGFVTPAIRGYHCVGASYQPGDDDLRETLVDHAGNLARVERLIPGFAADINAADLRGRVALRTVSRDRMPLLGALEHADGGSVLACLALASRGLTWAPLLGEALACIANDEPLPLERDLLRMLRPDR